MTDGDDGQAVELEERHASWAELFFDLVAVAGVAAMAHVLIGHLDLEALGLFALLFTAFWITWTTYMVYGNSAAGELRLARLLVGMFGLGVMAAAAPGVAHALLGEHHGEIEQTHVTVFVVAYVLARLVAANSWARGQVLTDFPLAQSGFGLLPWVASIWVDQPWQQVLWAVGIGIDVIGLFLISGERMLASQQAHLDRTREEVAQREARGELRVHRDREGNERTIADRVRDMVVQGVRLEPEHLAERLGLFIIIVLGESIIQVVRGAWEVEWDWHLLTAGVAAFALLVAMFTISLLHGHAGIPHLRSEAVTVRTMLALHALTAATLVALAVALGQVVDDGAEPLADSHRWLLCGAVAAYFVIGQLCWSVSEGLGPLRLALSTVFGVGVPVALALLADDTSAIWFVWYVVLVVLGHLLLARRTSPQAPEATA